MKKQKKKKKLNSIKADVDGSKSKKKFMKKGESWWQSWDRLIKNM